jgi:hypothetical protein
MSVYSEVAGFHFSPDVCIYLLTFERKCLPTEQDMSFWLSFGSQLLGSPNQASQVWQSRLHESWKSLTKIG